MKLRDRGYFAFPLLLLILAVVLAASTPASAQREFIYTPNFGDNNISGFSLNPGDGKTSEVPGSPFGSGVGPISITHSPDGRFVFAVMSSQFLGESCGFNNGELISYSVNPRNGALSMIDDVVLSGVCSTGVTIDPNGNFVYAASFPLEGLKGGIIDGFQTSNGHLIPLPDTPFASGIEAGSGQNPAIQKMAITPDGKVLYASNPNDSRGILIFDRDSSTGTLTFRTGVETGSAFDPIAIKPSGGFLFALGEVEFGTGQPGLFEFAIETHGDLTPVSGSPFRLPHDLANGVGISPDGSLVATVGAFSALTGTGISAFREDNQGRSLLVPGSPFGTVSAFDLVFDPDGRFVVIPGAVFKVDQDTGAFTQVSEFVPGTLVESIAVLKVCKPHHKNEDKRHIAEDKRADNICPEFKAEPE
ncbi:MAG TPA: beta-propeller fold lactonase family protein [Candidatus Angelobacter sp.]|nr:beta-propeller fold lactonase family protein [Candidatus Angelobacter sp.]